MHEEEDKDPQLLKKKTVKYIKKICFVRET